MEIKKRLGSKLFSIESCKLLHNCKSLKNNPNRR